ncbi:hypothetical protein C4J81_03280 [Deltaproteobacteria bacterium Smac51]|nr:hypothetical protein C4J81_03280 [Deltaproteobacteria bacterium Smac51]
MNEVNIQPISPENSTATPNAELAKMVNKPPREDLLKQMSESMQVQVQQMSLLALKLLGG